MRLKPCIRWEGACLLRAFQYQKGAIKTLPGSGSAAAPSGGFNTKKVRLKRIHSPERPAGALRGFNTKKVRLKPRRARRLVFRATPFQYQKGAIKTQVSNIMDTVQYSFQYQKGAIKTSEESAGRQRFGRFQYQKGAIKTFK